MKLVADWTAVLGIMVYENEAEKSFWLVIPETNARRAAIPENSTLVQNCVEAYVGCVEEHFDAKQTVHWALLRSLLHQ